MHRIILIVLITLFVAEIGLIASSFVLPAKEFVVENQRSQLAFLGGFNNSDVTLLMVGDIMLDRGIEMVMEKHNDWRWPFLKIREDIKEADILFGNLESVISGKGEKVGSIYSFRADPKVIEGLTFAGFDILSLANNHTLDYQRVALEDTMRILKENEIDYVGAGRNAKEAFSVKIKEIKGTKIGFLAYTNLGPEVWRATEENSGMAWISGDDLEKIAQDIKLAKEKVDVLVVSLHSGEEYQVEVTPFQREFSHLAVEAGADLVVGHHPHIIQEIEKYKSAWIVYSLGNFVFDQLFSEETTRGFLLEVMIENGKVKGVNPINIKINNSFQPEIF